MKQPFPYLFLFFILFYSCNNAQQKADYSKDFVNQLANEASPYLLQHKNNPVNWYPWGEQPIQKAKDQNQLLIVSIGYSSCHWCHVMEKESFEDSTVAKVMNDHFVSIKVDREERPDVDHIYMDAAIIISGNGGWPLNAIALPDKRPIYVATYLPKKHWINLLNQISEIWENEPEKLIEMADQIENGIIQNNTFQGSQSNETIKTSEIKSLTESWLDNFDMKFGGYSGAIKFPIPYGYQSLLYYHYLTGNEKAKEVVEISLDHISDGGIYDHLGGGFARYSTDELWKAPHFEKMLYDNAQLIGLYSDAYKVTKNEKYKNAVEQTIAFMEREWLDQSGGFYSSFDADSEGEEGLFYVWKKSEIDSILGDDSDVFCKYFQVTSNGNWEDGNNILFIKSDKKTSLEENQLEQLESWKEKLFEAREKREKPALDDKVITSWNALAIAGLLKAHQAFEEPRYQNLAIETGEFLLTMIKEDKLLRIYKEGKRSLPAFLDDYAFTIEAFIQLYQSTFDEKWLYEADELLAIVLKEFKDDQSPFFTYVSKNQEKLITNKLDYTDNVIPSPNAVMAHDLYILGTLLYKEEYLKSSREMLQAVFPMMQSSSPRYFGKWYQLLLMTSYPMNEVAIVGSNYERSLMEINSQYLPNLILLGGRNEGTLQLLENKYEKGKTMIYVCQEKRCKLPVDKMEEALKLIDK